MDRPPSSSARAVGAWAVVSIGAVVAPFSLFGQATPSAPVAPASTPADWVVVEVATVGVDLATGTPLALLRIGWDEVLPMWIGDPEAGAIARALAGTPAPRPMTHDLMVGVIETLGGTLEEVLVTELRGEAFIGVLRIRSGGEVREVDTRPSDGMALAARTGVPVRVARTLMGHFPDLDFLSVERGRSIARVRGVTVADPEEGGQGVQVLHVIQGVGGRTLLPGDRIISVAGAAVESPTDFAGALVRFPPDAAVEVERERDGEVSAVRIPARRPPPQVG
ncbi:hypothetical protein BH23GEM11_BH23GEM11_19240 [soil metagenome]